MIAIIIISCISQLLIAMFVLIKSPRNPTNILFSFLSAATIAWLLSNYASLVIVDPSSVLLSVRFTLFFVVMQNTLFCLFAKSFAGHRFDAHKLRLMLYIVSSSLVAALTLSSLVFSSVEVNNGTPVPEAQPLIMFFVIHAIYSIYTAFSALLKAKGSSIAIRNNQLRLLTIAASLNWLIVPVTNFILTLTMQTTIFIVLSPFYSLVFSMVIAYTIISTKLFDIRAVVARSVAYILIIAIVATVYSLTVFGLSQSVLSRFEGTVYEQLIFIGLAIFLALTFQPFKKYFDRSTNRLFFRDSYDIDAALDSLGKILAEQIDLEIIMHAINIHIVNIMKVQSMSLLVLDEGDSVYKSDSFGNKRDINISKAELGQFKSRSLSIIDQSDDNRNQIMRKYDIELISRLQTTEGVVGFVLVGPKASGGMLRSQDIKFLEIASKQLAIAVQNARYFSQISEFNATLQDKVDKATAKLEKTNEKLKELDSAKDEFISMASHQLRTPLTTVKGYLSMLLEDDAGKLTKQQTQFVEQAFSSSQRMVYLIADLLNVSRLSTGKFVIDSKPTDLAEVVAQEVDQLQRNAKAKNIKLSYKKPADFPIVEIDETKIRQVIMNFTDNALYYTKDGGVVEVSLAEVGRSIELKVKDNGIGVPQTLQHKLFTKFYRADNAQAVRPDGTGLGLFMAKKVILAQGGSIIFSSREGKGSTFGFTFPKKTILAKEVDRPNQIKTLGNSAKKIQVTTK